MALGKERQKPHHLIFAQRVKIAHRAPHVRQLESCRHDSLKQINGSGAWRMAAMENPAVPFDWASMFFGTDPSLFYLEIVFRTCVIYAYALALIR
jgi:hypothetical protein